MVKQFILTLSLLKIFEKLHRCESVGQVAAATILYKHPEQTLFRP